MQEKAYNGIGEPPALAGGGVGESFRTGQVAACDLRFARGASAPAEKQTLVLVLGIGSSLSATVNRQSASPELCFSSGRRLGPQPLGASAPMQGQSPILATSEPLASPGGEETTARFFACSPPTEVRNSLRQHVRRVQGRWDGGLGCAVLPQGALGSRQPGRSGHAFADRPPIAESRVPVAVLRRVISSRGHFVCAAAGAGCAIRAKRGCWAGKRVAGKSNYALPGPA